MFLNYTECIGESQLSQLILIYMIIYYIDVVNVIWPNNDDDIYNKFVIRYFDIIYDETIDVINDGTTDIENIVSYSTSFKLNNL